MTHLASVDPHRMRFSGRSKSPVGANGSPLYSKSRRQRRGHNYRQLAATGLGILVTITVVLSRQGQIGAVNDHSEQRVGVGR